MKRLLEVCVDNFESAMAAIAGGAGRLELCSALSEGGLTPTPGFLSRVQTHNATNIPIYCMLRCRSWNFIYSDEEIEIMKQDVVTLKKAGSNGFVFGALLENGDVDMKKCREIVKTAYPLPVTFHRAFDHCRRPTIEIEVIIDLGFERVLTSGKQKNAQLGSKLIKKLMEQVENRIIIMPGGGINKDNLKSIMETTAALEYHGSFKKVKEETRTEDLDAVDATGGPLYVTDAKLVTEIVQILNE